MKNMFAFIIVLILLPINTFSQEELENSKEPIEHLIGNWTIDLRPTLESKEYLKSFVVVSIEKNTFKGTFTAVKLKTHYLIEIGKNYIFHLQLKIKVMSTIILGIYLKDNCLG